MNDVIEQIAEFCSGIPLYRGELYINFYSIAQHNVILANYLPKQYTINCLFYNIHQALIKAEKEKLYCGIKHTNNYIERFEKEILTTFLSKYPPDDIIKIVDMRLRNTVLPLIAPDKYKVKYFDIKPLNMDLVLIQDKDVLKQQYVDKFKEIVCQ